MTKDQARSDTRYMTKTGTAAAELRHMDVIEVDGQSVRIDTVKNLHLGVVVLTGHYLSDRAPWSAGVADVAAFVVTYRPPRRS